MRIDGKQDGFVHDDLTSVGKAYGIKSAREIIEESLEAVARWPAFAAEAGVSCEMLQAIGSSHRLLISSHESPDSLPRCVATCVLAAARM